MTKSVLDVGNPEVESRKAAFRRLIEKKRAHLRRGLRYAGPELVLPDAEWSKIVRLLGIHDLSGSAIEQARTELQRAVGIYRRNTTIVIESSGPLTRERYCIRNLRASRQGDQKAQRAIDAVVEGFGLLEDEGPGKTGPKTGAAHTLIWYLIGFAERYTWKRIPYGKGGHFIRYVCGFAKTGIGSGTIDRVLRDYRSQVRHQALD
jgi:hypothetical protein